MKKNELGVITLEACISVLSFLILMLMLSGLFLMFMAQNVTAHTVLQTSQSLSLEAYATDKLGIPSGKIGEVGDYLGKFVSDMFGSSDENPYFVSGEQWYTKDNTTIAKAIKTRFVGYLTGGDESAADELLKNMNVVNGLNGLDFTSSYIANDTLYIVLKYELEYDFKLANVGNIPVEQTTCSKLWRAK